MISINEEGSKALSPNSKSKSQGLNPRGLAPGPKLSTTTVNFLSKAASFQASMSGNSDAGTIDYGLRR